MAKAKFGVSVAEEIAEEIDDLVEECEDLKASRSEIVEALLVAYLNSDDIDHGEQVRELIIQHRKGVL
jgi:metal-responsive CopG/Arc/MetJ family transcriptional regulator